MPFFKIVRLRQAIVTYGRRVSLAINCFLRKRWREALPSELHYSNTELKKISRDLKKNFFPLMSWVIVKVKVFVNRSLNFGYSLK